VIINRTESNVISSSGLQGAQTFQIKTNKHAFQMLSSGLYSDKISAVLREIGCNAADAHIAVGKRTLPIKVKLPNQIDNQFWIEDNGPGLSPDDIMGLYTTYFASTKQSSNDFTGAFGLGSKSPFSYTDSFTITSSFDGIKTIYTAHIGDDGNPVIAKLAEEATNTTGIRIGFPVKSIDFAEFQRKAQTIFQVFDPLPEILGGKAITPITYISTHAKSRCDLPSANNIQGVHARMGNVLYPIGYEKLGLNLDSLCKYILSYKNIIMRFDIGELQVAASREELQYDKNTINAITKRIESYAQEIMTELEELWLKAKASGWVDICAFRTKLHSVIPDNRYVLDNNVCRKYMIKDVESFMSGCSYDSFKIKAFSTEKVMLRRTGTYWRNSDKLIDYDSTDDINIGFDPKYVIVAGTAPYAVDRVRIALKTRNLERVFLVTANKKEKGTQANIDDAVDKLKAQLNGIKVIDVATLPSPAQTGVKKLKKGQLPPLTGALATATHKVYVPCKNGRFYVNNNVLDFWSSRTLRAYLAIIEGSIKSYKDPIEITKQSIRNNRLTKRTDWKLFDTYIKELFEDKNVIQEIKKAANFQVPKYDLHPNSHKVSFIPCMLTLKKNEPTIWSHIEPLAKKKGLLKDIEDIEHKIAKAPATNPSELLRAYNEISKTYELNLSISPAIVKGIDLEAKYQKGNTVTYGTYITLFKVSPEALLKLLGDILS
jgi:hypothetical protein